MIECPIFKNLVERLVFRDSCSRSCHMKLLNSQGRYKGTNKIAEYNRSEAHRQRCSELAKQRHLNKGSRGFSSEHANRVRNYNNIIKRESSDKDRFLYLIEFQDSIKVGSTSVLQRRLNELNPLKVILLIKGGSHEIAKLEFDTLVKFENYTLIDQSRNQYSEYLDKSILDEVISYLNEVLGSSTTIRKVDN